MSNYYDNELISFLNINEIKNFTILSQIDSIIELMMRKFQFKYGRVYFNGLKNKKYIKSNTNNISKDVVWFIDELIREDICNANEKIIYIGDALTDYGYEFYLFDLQKVIPYLVDNIPQHHYFLFQDGIKLMYVSFENEIQFGMLWEGDIHS
ncbi:MAG: hypothetical protein HDT30_01525 [Clostridiales bacterium]|nr:hypothetical protein [Clostridiales bacterium]